MKYGLMSAACYALATLLLMAFSRFGWPFWVSEGIAAAFFGFGAAMFIVSAFRYASKKEMLLEFGVATLLCAAALGFNGSVENHYAALILAVLLGLGTTVFLKMRGVDALYFVILQVAIVVAFWVMEWISETAWTTRLLFRFGGPSLLVVFAFASMLAAAWFTREKRNPPPQLKTARRKRHSIFSALDFKLPALNKEDEQLLDWSSHQL